MNRRAEQSVSALGMQSTAGNLGFFPISLVLMDDTRLDRLVESRSISLLVLGGSFAQSLFTEGLEAAAGCSVALRAARNATDGFLG